MKTLLCICVCLHVKVSPCALNNALHMYGLSVHVFVLFLLFLCICLHNVHIYEFIYLST